MSNQRHLFIDTLRGIAIFMVVLGHTFMFNGLSPLSGEIESTLPCIWFNIIYYFHMPLFFFISGYFLSDSPQDLKSVSYQIWEKFKRLFIPFIVCSFLLAMWKGYTYWFLKTLFTFFLICTPLSYIRYKFNCNIVVSLLYFVLISAFGIIASKTPILNFIIDFRIEFFIFFVLGFLNKKTNYMRFVSNELSAIFIIIAFAWAYIDNSDVYHSIAINYFVGFLIILVLWNTFSKMNEENRIMKLLSYLGTNTLEIYILHFYFGIKLPMISHYFTENIMSTDKSTMVTSLAMEVVVFSIIALCMTFLSLLVAKALKTNKYISLVLFGRK